MEKKVNTPMNDNGRPHRHWYGSIQTAAGAIRDIFTGDRTLNSAVQKLVVSVKILIATSRKFIDDECLTRASSLSYTAIMSLVPTLTVVLTFYTVFSGAEGKKEELFSAISFFLKENNINITIDPIFAALSSLIDNAGKIGGISAVVMVFTATALLRSLEASLNFIWKVKKQRPLFLRVIYYWAILTLGPVMLIAGTAVATQLSAFFSAPNFNGIAFSSTGTVWITGNNGGIFEQEKGKEPVQLTMNRIDLDNQQSFIYDETSGSFIEQDHHLDSIQFKKTEFNGASFIGDRGWIAGDRGVLLMTSDRGRTWSLMKLDSYNLRDIWMMDGDRGFIVGDRGVMLKTEDGGRTWQRQKLEWVSVNLNSIEFKGQRGLATGDSGTLVQTYDGGKTWLIDKLKAAERGGRYVNLYDSFIVNDYLVYVAGSEGILLKSSNGGLTWVSKKFQEYNYRTLYFFNSREGVAAGDRGTVITTKNGGESWTRTSLPTYQIKKLLYDGSTLTAVGDTGLLMSSRNRGANWEGREGRSVISLFINFLAPFAFIWMLFLISYIALPNTRIPFRHAAIGASFTSAVWVIFILLFIYYTRIFARGTLAIYGALAAIPLFLLIIYSSSVILLYGAELAYILMHPELYRTFSLRKGTGNGIPAHYGIAILQRIYEKFERGSGPTGFKELLQVASHNTEAVDHFTGLFIDEGLITRLQDGRWSPAKTSRGVLMADVIESLDRTGFLPPRDGKKSGFNRGIRELFGTLSKKRKEALDGVTLADLMEQDTNAGHST